MFRILIIASLILLLATIPSTLANKRAPATSSSYRLPTINGTVANCDSQCLTSAQITIIGDSLSYDGDVRISPDRSNKRNLPCAGTFWLSESEVVCQLPPAWPNDWIGQFIFIFYNNSLGDTFANSYATFGSSSPSSSSGSSTSIPAPVINSFGDCESNVCYSGDQLAIYGQYLSAVTEIRISIHADQSDYLYCSPFSISGDYAVYCSLPIIPSDWSNQWLYVTVISPGGMYQTNADLTLQSSASSSSTGGVSPSIPWITSVSGCSDMWDCNAGDTISVTGQYFSNVYAVDISVTGSDFSNSCYNVNVYNDSYLECLLPSVDSSWYRQWTWLSVINDQGPSTAVSQFQYSDPDEWSYSSSAMPLGAWLGVGGGSLITLILFVCLVRYCCMKRGVSNTYTRTTPAAAAGVINNKQPLLVVEPAAADHHHHHIHHVQQSPMPVSAPVCGDSSSVISIPMPRHAYPTHYPSHAPVPVSHHAYEPVYVNVNNSNMPPPPVYSHDHYVAAAGVPSSSSHVHYYSHA